MDVIDIEIFKFISGLKSFPLKEVVTQSDIELKGIEPVVELGPVKNLSIQRTDIGNDSLTVKFVDINGMMTGLGEVAFKDLKELVAPVLDIPMFYKYADLAFIVENAFKWIIEVYKAKKADQNFSTYLIDQLNSAVEEQEFHFRIKPLWIQENFSVGGIQIRYYAEEEIKNHYEDFQQGNTNKSYEEFKEFYKSHFPGIYLSVKGKGVPSRAEAFARRKAEEVVDVLKCFCTDWAIEPQFKMFDLDYRLSEGRNAIILRLPKSSFAQSEILYRNSRDVLPIELKSEVLHKFKALGLDEVSLFLEESKDTELRQLILDSIKFLSQIISTLNRYEKVVKCISFIENIVVPKVNEGRAKGLTRVKKLIPKVTQQQVDIDRIIEAFSKGYKIRDRYLHNYIELEIDRSTLFYMLEFERALIIKLIRISKNRISIQEAYDFLDIK